MVTQKTAWLNPNIVLVFGMMKGDHIMFCQKEEQTKLRNIATYFLNRNLLTKDSFDYPQKFSHSHPLALQVLFLLPLLAWDPLTFDQFYVPSQLCFLLWHDLSLLFSNSIVE